LDEARLYDIDINFNTLKVYKSKFEYINDGMIARCFGYINKELDLEEVDNILNKYKNEHKVYEIDKNNIKNFSVNLLEKGRLKGLVDNRNYIACLIRGTITENKNFSTVNSEKNEIESKQEEEEVEIRIPAWIFKDEIVFSGAQTARDFAIPYFKDLLKIEIKIPHYNISKIYNDFKSTGEIFGFGFIDRPNPISAGSIFGEMESDDPLVSELDNSDKNFIAMNLRVGDKIIRVSVYSVGSIVIMQKWISMAENYSRLKLVREALKAYEIKV